MRIRKRRKDKDHEVTGEAKGDRRDAGEASLPPCVPAGDREGGQLGKEESAKGDAEDISIVAVGLLMRVDGYTFAVPYGVMAWNGGPHLAYCVSLSTPTKAVMPDSAGLAGSTKSCTIAVWDTRGYLAEGTLDITEAATGQDTAPAEGLLALRGRLPVNGSLLRCIAD